MALALVGGAAIGALFGALYDVVKESIGRTVMQYKPLLGDLKFTLDSLRPRIIQQIGDHNVELGLPNEDIESLQRQMEEGIVLVRRLSNIGMWNCSLWCSSCSCTKSSYTDQLVELDRSLRILLEILKLQEARDVKEVLLLARKINDKQDELEKKLSDLLRAQEEAGNAQESSGSNRETTVQEQNEGNGGQQMAPSDGGVGASTLGVVFAELFDTVALVKDKTMMLKRPLEDLKSTLDSLKPLIEEISAHNKVLNLPKEELEDVRIQMENGVELIHKSSKVHQWTSYKKYEYTNKLLGLDESLQRLLNILRLQLVRDVRESLAFVRNIETVINRLEGSGVVQVQNVEIEGSGGEVEPPPRAVGLNIPSVQGTRDVKVDSVAESALPAVGLDAKNIQLGTRDVKEISVSNVEARIKGIPGEGVFKLEAPDAEHKAVVDVPSSVTFGLDVFKWELKKELLKDDVSAVVLMGPPGSGITALAKFFFEDDEVKAIFKNNIFFVWVSKNPNLSLIVQKLYQQIENKGYQIPELQDETVALNWLQQFLKETGQKPSLLVVDDVWPGSEFLLGKFDEFKTSNHKILMTSRFELQIFGSPHHLLSMNDEDNTTLSPPRSYSFELLNDEDLVSFSPEPPFTSLIDHPGAHFHDSSATILEDKSSYVSKDVGSIAHFQDFSASSLGDGSSYVSKTVGTKQECPHDNTVKSMQTNMQQKLELKVSGGDKKIMKIMKAVAAIDGVDSISPDVKNQKVTVVGQLDPVQILTRLRKIAPKTEVISFGPAKEEIKEDQKEGKKERNLAMKEKK